MQYCCFCRDCHYAAMTFPPRALALLLLLALLAPPAPSAPLYSPRRPTTDIDDFDEILKPSPKEHGCTVIDDVLEDLRRLIRNGLPESDIPVLDPLVAEKYKFSVQQEPSLAANIALRKMRIEGFGDFVTKTLLPAPGIPVPPDPTIHFIITVPLISVIGEYKARGQKEINGEITPIQGDGPFLCEVNNLTIDVKAELGVTFKLRAVRVRLALGDIKVKVEVGGDETEKLISEACARLERWFVFTAPLLEDKAELFIRYYIKSKVNQEPMWLVNKMKKF